MAVVLGFIPTPVGFAALDAAAAEAELRGGPLVLVNVIRDGDEDDPRHAHAEQLDRAMERLHRLSVRVDVRQVRTDADLSSALLDVVEEERAELLVLGIRRDQEVARHLLGTTAQKLLLSAPCDVLIV
ncbi:universal stress protein [Brachybacterium sp. EF45031]|uniref:universal stress protein n=1 Tax=Brachybacterium sillae TaxID=2810536 RepID=UPI00217F22D8|nr:universal stress protein [Brachybacterium sillae]MCS6712222.1 universal stress protein [Brachybacterium sillae]